MNANEQQKDSQVSRIMVENQARPDDNMTMSFLSLLFCLCGIVPLILSIKSRNSYQKGDLVQAKRYGRYAKIFSIVSIVLGLIYIITKVVEIILGY